MTEYISDDSLLEMPDADQIARVKGGAGRVCGECAKFAHGEGQLRMERQRFLESVVRDYGWQLHHLGAPPDQLGLCGETVSGERLSSGQGLMICSVMTCAMKCDGFRPKNGRISIGNKG